MQCTVRMWEMST